MVESATLLISALDGVAKAGRYGKKLGDPGVIVSEVRAAGLATVTARKERRAALLDAAGAVFGVELPTVPRRVEGRDIAFVWSGSDHWLTCKTPAPAIGMEACLAAAFAGLASIVDQSHGRMLLRAAGPRIRDALAKGLSIDLHPREFRIGHVAITAVAHIGIHVWQIDDCPTYEIAVPRGYTRSFWHWLSTSSAEYGLELAAAGSTSY